MDTDGPPGDGVARLVPVLARVLELGRGPGALAGWVRPQIPPAVAPAARARLARRLAGELARHLLPQARVATQHDGAGETLPVR
jgi:hypothetical protein